MKKTISLILALMLCLSLCACADETVTTDTQGTQGTQQENETSAPTEDETPEETIYQIGDTASGEMFDFTLESVEYVEGIEHGRYNNTYSVTGEGVSYHDAIPEEGYSMIKIDLSVDYHGKEKKEVSLLSALTLDYDDGYEFKPVAWNGSMPTTQDRYKGAYLFNRPEDVEIDITDPLAFKKATRTVYVFVNEVVESNTEAPLILKVSLSTDEFVFDLR